MAYKYSIGQPFVYPKNDLDYTSNFLRMCFAVPAEDYEVNPVLARAMAGHFVATREALDPGAAPDRAGRRFTHDEVTELLAAAGLQPTPTQQHRPSR